MNSLGTALPLVRTLRCMSISSIFLTHENILSPKRINVNQRDQQSQPPMKATSIIAALLLAPHVAAFAPMRAAKVSATFLTMIVFIERLFCIADVLFEAR